jgi:hypothetical protein
MPLGSFGVFVEPLKIGTKVVAPSENAGEISLSSKEFWLANLLSQCSDLQLAAALSE